MMQRYDPFKPDISLVRAADRILKRSQKCWKSMKFSRAERRQKRKRRKEWKKKFPQANPLPSNRSLPAVKVQRFADKASPSKSSALKEVGLCKKFAYISFELIEPEENPAAELL